MALDPRADPPDGVDARLAAALERLAQVQRVLLQQAATAEALSPVQARIVGHLAAGARQAHSPSALAAEFGVTRATVADAVAALARKGLVERSRAGGDARRVDLRLTPEGFACADAVASWNEPLRARLRALPEGEQGALLASLLGLIADLQADGTAPTTGMCLTCRWFRAKAHADAAAPHHCGLLDAPLAERQLRVDCPEHEPTRQIV